MEEKDIKKSITTIILQWVIVGFLGLIASGVGYTVRNQYSQPRVDEIQDSARVQSNRAINKKLDEVLSSVDALKVDIKDYKVNIDSMNVNITGVKDNQDILIKKQTPLLGFMELLHLQWIKRI